MCQEGLTFETPRAKVHIFCFIMDLMINQYFQVALLTRYHLGNVRITQKFLFYIKRTSQVSYSSK